MTPFPNHDGKLEQRVHELLRDLPNRRAPRSLEQRVMAEIARLAALPWWRKSFGHWPVVARAGFILVCAGLVRLALTLGFDSTPLKQSFAQPYSWMESGIAIINAITSFVDIMLRNIPPLWLYGGLALFAAMYATLFGLGAAAYRALHAQR